MLPTQLPLPELWGVMDLAQPVRTNSKKKKKNQWSCSETAQPWPGAEQGESHSAICHCCPCSAPSAAGQPGQACPGELEAADRVKPQGKHGSRVELKLRQEQRSRGSEDQRWALLFGPTDQPTQSSPTRTSQQPGNDRAAKCKASAKKQLGKGAEITRSCTAGNLLPSSHTHTVLLRVCLPINKATN